jgi:glycosyltransferase involved in cell wall biosynthesis
MMLRACFVCSEYPPALHGGIGSVTQLLARGLRQRGHDVRVIGVYPPGSGGLPYEEDEGVRVWRLFEPAHPGGWIAARYALYRTVRAWSRRGEIDFVEAPDWAGWTAGWAGLGVPIIVRLHGSESYFAAEMGTTAPRIIRLLERAALRGADARCSVSRYTAGRTAELFGLPAGDAVVYNAVDGIDDAPPAPRSRHRVLFSGTLTRKKGIFTLLRAWPAVLAAVPEAELHLYGKAVDLPASGGPNAADLIAGAGPSIVWHGHVARPALLEALRGARAAVFPSYAEAFAMAPLEAMACGCPTIYTRRGSGPELAEDGREALLVDPDDAEQLALVIVRLLTDDALAHRLGAAGRVAVRHRFSLDALVRQNESFFRSCLTDERRVDLDHRLHLPAR